MSKRSKFKVQCDTLCSTVCFVIAAAAVLKVKKEMNVILNAALNSFMHKIPSFFPRQCFLAEWDNKAKREACIKKMEDTELIGLTTEASP